MNSTGQRILDAREDRWLRKKALLEKYRVPVTSMKLNIPGPEKDGDIVLVAHERITREFLGLLKELNVPLICTEKNITADGPDLLIASPVDAREMKGHAMAFEREHPLGRLVDVDVMDLTGSNLSRQDLGMEQRLCLLCPRPAVECAVSGRHERTELIEKAQKMILSYLDN